MDTARLDELRNVAESELKSGLASVNPQLEELSQEQLLELVKTISLVRTAEGMLTGENTEARGDLDKVINDIMNLQETVVGVTQLMHDLQTVGGTNE